MNLIELYKELSDRNPDKGIPHPEYRRSSGGHKVEYFIPKWLGLNTASDLWIPATNLPKLLESVGLTNQIYYDIVILGLSSPDERPKCNHKDCNNTTIFYNPTRGYSRYCSISCGSKGKPKGHYFEVGNQVNKGRRATEEQRLKQSVSRRKYYKEHPEVLASRGGSHRFKRGWYYLKRFDRKVQYLSSYELDFLKEYLEISTEIVDFLRVPPINYYNSRKLKTCRYFADFYLELTTGDKVLVEIKPKALLSDDIVIAKAKAARKYCSDNGISYLVLIEDDLYLDRGCHNFNSSISLIRKLSEMTESD